MATLKEQLEAMRQLGENWEGYGAAAPVGETIDFATELAAVVEAALLKRPPRTLLHVSRTRTEGVLLEWEDNAWQHEVEINPDGSIGFLHLDLRQRPIGGADGQTVSPAWENILCDVPTVSSPRW